MELPTLVRSWIEQVPSHMAMERRLIKLIADSIDNEYCMSYNGVPYNDFDYELWDRIRDLIDSGHGCSQCSENGGLHSILCPRGYGRKL